MPRMSKFATPAEFEAEYRRLKAIPLPSRGKPKTDERRAWERARNARRYAKACAFEGPEARRKRLDRRNDLQRERMNIPGNRERKNAYQREYRKSLTQEQKDREAVL